jgi:leucyl aminopeptidase
LVFSPLSPACKYDPNVAAMLAEAQPSRWLGWIKALSGAEPIQTSYGSEKILTRSSLVLFEPDTSPSAFDYLQDELIELGFKKGQDFAIHTYAFPYGDRYPERNWKNLILTFPGADPKLQKERVLLVAHMDSNSEQEYDLAPGADDNASGAAGLLEAAAILRHYQFGRTINLIWFSGEEKSRIGSLSFVQDYADWMPGIVGVINLDMFAFDGDNDRCFEVHAGTLTGSQSIGECIGSVIENYDLDLTYDFIDDSSAYQFSDHYPFWQKGVPAVMINENAFYHPDKTCGKSDRNYGYHTAADTVNKINVPTGFSILQAGIGAVAHMAEPLGPCFLNRPDIHVLTHKFQLKLDWLPMENAEAYQIWWKNSNRWQMVGETTQTEWKISVNFTNQPGFYQVSGISAAGCQSSLTFVSLLEYFPSEKKPR